MRLSHVIAGGVLLGILAAVLAVVLRAPPQVAAYHADLSPAAIRRVHGFTVYGVGRGIDGQAPSGNAAVRRGARVQQVTLEYGRCVYGGGDEPTCVYPLVLQSTRRHSGTTGRVIRRFGGRIEVVTARTGLIIWAVHPQLAQDALAALRRENRV